MPAASTLHRHAAHADAINAQTSLPPSEVIRAIREGSISLRIEPDEAIAVANVPVWLLDDASGNLQQLGVSDKASIVRLSINEDQETDTTIPDAASQYATAVYFKQTPTAGWHTSAWLQVLREMKDRWL